MAYIGVQPAEAYTSFAVQHFTTSATTSYTLDNSVANENEIALFINNVRQQPGSSYAYTASGTTLTLSAATSASDTMYCVFIGKAVQTVTPTLPIANFSSTGIDDNATSTAATIDSSGNVLVGTTDTSVYNNSGSGQGGASINIPSSGSGYVQVARDSGTALYLNRLVDDGAIIDIRQNGTQRGTVGTFSSLPYFASASNGILIGSGNVVPSTNTGAISDNALDLGASNRRWQDLYLGGNIYLGGTGSANALTDYEEGTFTPTAEFAASQPTAGNTTGVGSYTKVGNMVTVWGTVENFNVTGASGDLRVRNLPFTSTSDASLGGYQGTAQLSRINYATDCYVTAEVPDNLNYVRFAESLDNNARDFINKENCLDGQSDVYFCVTYKTDS